MEQGSCFVITTLSNVKLYYKWMLSREREREREREYSNVERGDKGSRINYHNFLLHNDPKICWKFNRSYTNWDD